MELHVVVEDSEAGKISAPFVWDSYDFLGMATEDGQVLDVRELRPQLRWWLVSESVAIEGSGRE